MISLSRVSQLHNYISYIYPRFPPGSDLLVSTHCSQPPFQFTGWILYSTFVLYDRRDFNVDSSGVAVNKEGGSVLCVNFNMDQDIYKIGSGFFRL